MEPTKEDLANIITELVSSVEVDTVVCSRCGANLLNGVHKDNCICEPINCILAPEEVVVGGLYKHCKGTTYRVLNIGLFSEDKTPMVIYSSIEDPTLIWVRPLAMFKDNHKSGVKRFVYQGK